MGQELEQRIEKEEQRRARPSQEELLCGLERAILRTASVGHGQEVKALCEARSMLLGPLPPFAGGGVVGTFTRVEKGEEVLHGTTQRTLDYLRKNSARNLGLPEDSGWSQLFTRMRQLEQAELERCAVGARELTRRRQEAARFLRLPENTPWGDCLVHMDQLSKDAEEERSAVVSLHRQHVSAVSGLLGLGEQATWDDCLNRIRELADPPEAA